MIKEHLDKNNLHHAYLIEGARDEIVPEILTFCENINIKTSGNPDFCHISIDNFKIDEAFDLRAMSVNKSFSSKKRIFVVSVNSFSLDAQNVLLKMFEEPVPDTHFFLIVQWSKLIKIRMNIIECVNQRAVKYCVIFFRRRVFNYKNISCTCFFYTVVFIIS